MLLIAIKYTINDILLKNLIVLLFVWNFSYGIFPNYKYNYYNDKELVAYMAENKEKIFIIKSPTTRNQYFYKTGISDPKNIFVFNKLSNDSLKQIIKVGKIIYTDVIKKPEVFNKEKMTSIGNGFNFNTYAKEQIFSYEGFYGQSVVNKITE